MFNNAWLYNRKTSRVYKYCSKLAEVFEQEIDPVMQSLSYCCGRKVRRSKRPVPANVVLSGEDGDVNFSPLFSAAGVFSSDVVLLRKAALHYSQRRRLLQLPEQVWGGH